MRTLVWVLAISTIVSADQKNGPALDEVMARVAAYVASYGEKAAVVVATENYRQFVSVSFSSWSAGTGGEARPRDLVAEFAIVRAGDGWTGYRDVLEFDGRPVQDRRDRLVSLLTDTAGDASELVRIANENARFNVGPIIRNFNVPTAALFFFTPKDLGRFTFTHKGTPKVDGIPTWEITFKETQRPALIRTRGGADVPIEGTLWVKPDDGVVVKTLVRMKNFVGNEVSSIEGGPAQPVRRRSNNPASNNGGREALSGDQPIPEMGKNTLESEASMEVTYRKPPTIDVWFPAEMLEFYSGPIIANNKVVIAGARTRARYSNFRQFGTSIKIVQ